MSRSLCFEMVMVMFLSGFNKWLSMVVLKSNRVMLTRKNCTMNVKK